MSAAELMARLELNGHHARELLYAGVDCTGVEPVDQLPDDGLLPFQWQRVEPGTFCWAVASVAWPGRTIAA